MTFNTGMILERLAGVDTGHDALLDWIDAWLEEREPRPLDGATS